MIVYSLVLCILVDVLLMDLNIDVVLVELVLPSVERISTAIWI